MFRQFWLVVTQTQLRGIGIITLGTPDDKRIDEKRINMSYEHSLKSS